MHFNSKNSIFLSGQIRELSYTELCYIRDLEALLSKRSEQAIIAFLPTHFSVDQKLRPLILHTDIVYKIEAKHGKINPENLLINAHDWNIAIKNLDSNPLKINLIKSIPESDNFLLIGAIQDNGYYVLTHFEVESLKGNELKSLLGRGDVIRRDA